MNRSDLIALSEVPLFKGVDILELDKYFSSLDLSIRQYNNDQIILNQGDPCEELPVILRGEAGAFMTAPNGKQIRIETLTGPCAAASAILFATEQSFPVSLVAEGELSILKIPKPRVLDLMHSFPDFLQAYLKEGGDKLVFLSEKIRLFQFKTLKQKIIGHILMISTRQGGDDIRMIYSREELSQLMAVARPSLSREVSALVKDGYIETKGRNVKILKRKELLMLLADDKS